MRVLQLPLNIASQASVNVRSLRDIGVDARGLVRANDDIQDPRGLHCFPPASLRQHPIRGALLTANWWHSVLRAIRWADVVHWHSSWALRGAFDVHYAARLGKVGVVEFWGSDIRKKAPAGEDNSYWAEFCRSHPELVPDDGRSHDRQAAFARNGFACLLPDIELEAYLDRDLFPTFHRCGTPLVVDEYAPRYPDIGCQRPLVLHMPSHKARKGTDAVLKAVNHLRSTHDFDFRLVHDMKRSDALAIVRSCDVFLDQFVAGSFGFASREAMAFGKPTICYVRPSLLDRYPIDLPIVVATQDNLSEVLRELLEDGLKRHEIGRASRAYAERHYDSRRIATRLATIYQGLLAQ